MTKDVNSKKSFQQFFAMLLIVGIILIVGVGLYFWQRHNNQTINTQLTNLTQQVESLNKQVSIFVTPKKVVSSGNHPTTSAYYIGDTQTENGLTIKLDSTYKITQAQSAMPIPPNDILFGVKITVTNDNKYPISEQIGTGLSAYSLLYTQIGTNTSTGQYVFADTGNESAGCIGNAINVIQPQQTINSCLQFGIPKNVLADTFFYKQLQWYL